MAGSANRLVRRIHLRQQSVAPVGSPSRPTPQEVAELEARVGRLRAIGEPFAAVELSTHVADAAAVLDRGRGECVATEV